MVSEACSSSRRPRLASRILSERPSPVSASFSRICFPFSRQSLAPRHGHRLLRTQLAMHRDCSAQSVLPMQRCGEREFCRLLGHGAQGRMPKLVSYVSVKRCCCQEMGGKRCDEARDAIRGTCSWAEARLCARSRSSAASWRSVCASCWVACKSCCKACNLSCRQQAIHIHTYIHNKAMG